MTKKEIENRIEKYINDPKWRFAEREGFKTWFTTWEWDDIEEVLIIWETNIEIERLSKEELINLGVLWFST